MILVSMFWAEKGIRVWLLAACCIAAVGAAVAYTGWKYTKEPFQGAAAPATVPNQLGIAQPSVRIKACSELQTLRNQFTSLVASMKRSMSDVSGLPFSKEVALAAKSENMVFQYRHTDRCTTLIQLENPTRLELEQKTACIALASQDQLLYNTIIPAYDLTNRTIYEQEIAINDTLDTINDTITLLKCDVSGLTFSADDDVGTVDNDELRAKLNILSPYYISGATLKYITDYLVGNGLLDSALFSSSDIFKNVWGITQGIQKMAPPTPP